MGSINCSLADIKDFINTLEINLNYFHKIYSCEGKNGFFSKESYGGIFGKIYDILINNQKISEEEYKQSLFAIEKDIMCIRDVLGYNNDKKIVIENKIDSLNYKIEEGYRKIEGLQKKNTQENNNELLIQSQMNKINSLEREISSLNAKYEVIENNNSELLKLEDALQTKAESFKTLIRNYEMKLNSIETMLSNMSKVYNELLKENEKLVKVADEAYSIVESIQSNLSKISNKEYSMYDKVDIEYYEKLNECANDFINIKDAIDNLFNELDNVLFGIKNIISDSVIDEAVLDSKEMITALDEESKFLKDNSDYLKKVYQLISQYIIL